MNLKYPFARVSFRQVWRKSLRVGFQVLTVANMKMAAFWVVALCSLVEVY
jgi:hypothetical protein